MRPADNIEKLIRKLRYTADAQTHQRILGNTLNTLENRERRILTNDPPGKWRRIINSPTTKFAAAAIIIIAALVGLKWFTARVPITSKAYGISDVPRLLRTAQTFHTKGFRWSYVDAEPNFPDFVRAKMVPIENWIDLPNLRKRSITFVSSRRKGEERRLDRLETIWTEICYR